MHELLSMPRQRKDNFHTKLFTKGLPINSLPGWENIPLNRKLPMLKCPTKQVIFSKSKIGQNLLHNLHHDFNTSVREEMPEYNALHDPNLKPYYSNQRNLRRLRENGEITNDNDVICTLKDFNKFREELHDIHLYATTKQFRYLEEEQRDRVLIANAEVLRQQDYLKADKQEPNARQRKLEQEKARQAFFEKQLEIKSQKFKRVAEKKEMDRIERQRKSKFRRLRAEKHKYLAMDYQRKRLIKIKKTVGLKQQRFLKQLESARNTAAIGNEDEEFELWQRRLKQRIERGKLLRKLMEENNLRRNMFIEKHRETYQTKWKDIENKIRLRAELSRKKFFRKMGIKKTKKVIVDPNKRSTFFAGVLDTDLGMVLQYSVDPQKMPFDQDDPMYKAANFIVEILVNKFHDNLIENRELFKAVVQRLHKFFDECHKDCVRRATQLIDAISTNTAVPTPSELNLRRRTTVSFDFQQYAVGTASYEIHPNVIVKKAAGRLPTPRGSLSQIPASLYRDSEVYIKDLSFFDRSDIDISNEVLLFVEHLIARFKRQLLVSIGRRTFRAIRCHFQNKITRIRKELLDISKNYLAEIAAKGILEFGVNKLNFYSSLRLCGRALSMEVIYYLQTTMLDVKIDPRCIKETTTALTCEDGSELKVCQSSMHSFKSFYISMNSEENNYSKNDILIT